MSRGEGTGLRGAVGRVRAALLPSRSAAEMWKLTAGLSKAVRGGSTHPSTYGSWVRRCVRR